MVKVSIIVPVFNVEKYLGKCLDTLVNQTLEDIEIILIDDGSTDGSLEIVKDYYQKYPEKIIYKSIANAGAANARNIALQIAKGEYVGFVDSDDYVDLTMYEKMYSVAKEQEAEIVTCGYNRINMQDIQRRDVRQRKCFGYNVFQSPQLFINNVPYIWNKIFKKSLITENHISFENLRIFEDLVFTYKLFLKANKIVRVSETLYNYIFVREGSLTYTFGEKRFDLFKAFDSLLDYFEENRAMLHFETELLFILLNHIFVVCGNDVKYKDIPLKYKFINEGFRYLDEKFPFWRSTDLYFRKYKKNKFLFTKKSYWKIRTLIPVPVKRWWQNFRSLKRRLNYNKTGAVFYRAYTHKEVHDNRILLNSQQGSNLNGNMFYLLKYMCYSGLFLNYEIGIAYQKKKINKFKELLENYGLNCENVRLLPINTKEYAQFLATSKYLFNDTSFPVYFTKRKEQVYLNTWHGTPLKTLGRATAKDYYDIANLQKNFLAADYLLYPSRYMKDHMFEDYMLTDIFKNRIMFAGYPRNEIFFDVNRREQVRIENFMEGKQTIAYMPTWRGNVRLINKGQLNDIVEYLTAIDKELTDNQIMYVNLHPYLADNVKYAQFSHVKPFPKEYETYDFLNACDILVTDYSSVFFDYAVTNKKIILFAYDEDEYFANRGVYIHLDELPFCKVNTVEKLIEEINNPYIEDRTEYLAQFSPYECGNISEKICNQIILKKESDLLLEQPQYNSKEHVMIHINSLQEDNSLENFEDILKESNLDERIYYFTYNTKALNGREKYMLNFPKKLQYLGKLNPFSTATLFQSFVLYKIEKRKWYSIFFDKYVKRALSKEKNRAFGNVDFSCNIIWGREAVKEIEYVSEMQGSRIMYIQEKDDLNLMVPKKVYEKYTYIILEDPELNEEVQKFVGKTRVIVKHIKCLNDFFLVDDNQ